MTSSAHAVRRPLPVGTRLVHIGPPKTGTTSLQAAFHASRGSLLAQGVRYAGRTAHSRRIAYACLRRPEYSHLKEPPPAQEWLDFAAEVRAAAEARVVVSSEIFTDGDDDSMHRVIHDLGPDRVHVVVTLRPLARILASQWQQAIKGGLKTPLDAWLKGVLEGDGRAASTFWHRHRHDLLIERWAMAAGPGNLTVVVVDDRDHGLVLRAFEELLGLQSGTLPEVRDRSNRSMTQFEADTLQAFNRAFSEAGLRSQWAHRVRQRTVRRYLQSRNPGPEERRIEAPPWALDRAHGVALEMVAAIRTSGVPVIGDLDRLATPGGSGEAGATGQEATGPVSLPPSLRSPLRRMRVIEPFTRLPLIGSR